MYTTYPHTKIPSNQFQRSDCHSVLFKSYIWLSLFLCEVKKMLCLFNHSIQHSSPAPVIKTVNDPNSAISLIFQLPGLASNQWSVAGEMEACYTASFCSAVLYFHSAWAMILLVRIHVEKAFISPSLLSAMFDYLKKKKHLLWSSSCHVLEGKSDIFSVIDVELHLNSVFMQLREYLKKTNNNLHSWVNSMWLHRLWLSFIQPVLKSKNVKNVCLTHV